MEVHFWTCSLEEDREVKMEMKLELWMWAGGEGWQRAYAVSVLIFEWSWRVKLYVEEGKRIWWKNVRLRITALKTKKGNYLGVREGKNDSKKFGAIKWSTWEMGMSTWKEVPSQPVSPLWEMGIVYLKGGALSDCVTVMRNGHVYPVTVSREFSFFPTCDL